MVSQDYTDLNSMLTENDELLGILKEAVGAWGTIALFSGVTTENQHISARIDDDLAETRVEHLRDRIP
jgi:hypothetical protein